jgi:2,4-dienoyl-CoA reductase-like NADH-dependent reductase (Old Yellow Enzyme family)
MPAIFEPFTLRSLTIRNRLWVAPMCQYSVDERDGVPTDWHLVHLGQFAAGGAGLVVTEATAVSAEGRITPQDTGIWNDEQAASWARIVTFLHSQGAAAGIQLAHAGRKASTFRPWSDERGTVPPEEGGWEPVAPTAIAFPGYATPRSLDTTQIQAIVSDFAAAARRSVHAGFDVLEIHAAHGYLLHEFLSPLSNQRTDPYGGTLENRARFLLEVVRAVRAAAPDTVLFVRFSATDWTEGGWDENDTTTVAGWAAEAGADLFDVSTGGNVPATIPLEAGYQVRFATLVRDAVDAPVCAVGLITDPEEAEEIVRSGRADAIMMGREFLRDPHLPLRAAAILGATPEYTPPQYLRAPFV